MLSFVFFADGPCYESSWRVNDDKNQWWSRRDALVRITSTSIWMQAGLSNGVVGDSAYLFRVEEEVTSKGNNQTANYTSPVILHNGELVSKRISIPTERNLLRLWKDAFSKASKSQLGICLSGPANLSNGGILCSNVVWGELAFQKGGMGDSRSSTKIDTTKLDKRELLKLLQHSCSVDFLRKHGLNGSEALILKKKNRDAVLAAYTDWYQPSGSSNTGKDSNSSITNVRATSYQQLVDTCKVLLGGIMHRAASLSHIRLSIPSNPTGYLLFLHEDYPQELNVFSSTTNSKVDEQAVPVICAMGAVRDARENEVRAMMEAAVALGMHCVGANLGRTAEFTSKIVTALISHAIEGRLYAAVSKLPVVNASKIRTSISTERTILHSCIEKLTPVRQGGWTWDGSSNKTALNKRKHNCTTDTNNDGQGLTKKGKKIDDNAKSASSGCIRIAQHHMHIVAWLPILPEDITEHLDARERMHGLIQLVVSALWRSRLASEASHSAETTTTDDCLTSDNKSSGQEHDPTAKVIPILYLVFKDGRVAGLTQRKLAIAMANQHMAAPSEYQVLLMLKQLLSDSSVYCVDVNAADNHCKTSGQWRWGSVLKYVLPAGLDKRERKAVRIVHLTDTADVCCDNRSIRSVANTVLRVHESAEKKGVILKRSLSDFAYAGECTCSDSHCDNSDSGDRGTMTNIRHDIVMLINPLFNTSTVAANSANIANSANNTACDINGTYFTDEKYLQCLYEYVYPHKTVPTRKSGELNKKVGKMSFTGPLHGLYSSSQRKIAPYLAVTTLQHFAYHDRLYAAIEGALQ